MNGITTMNEALTAYMRSGMFFLDIIATAPSFTLLCFYKRNVSKFFMLIRFSHWPEIFFPFQYVIDRFSTMAPVKKAKYMSLAKVFIFVLILGHFSACMWILLG